MNTKEINMEPLYLSKLQDLDDPDITDDKKLHIIRSMLGYNFHLALIHFENETKWKLFYGKNDHKFYSSDYCKSIMTSDENSLEELINFTKYYIGG